MKCTGYEVDGLRECRHVKDRPAWPRPLWLLEVTRFLEYLVDFFVVVVG